MIHSSLLRVTEDLELLRGEAELSSLLGPWLMLSSGLSLKLGTVLLLQGHKEVQSF